jgi:hypothetical protein
MPGSTNDRKPTSWTARVIAPLILVVIAAAIVLVITGSLSSSSDEGSKATTSQATTTGCNPAADQAVKDGYYVVKADDVEGLSGIADKTCVSIDQLTTLNPNLDPQALQVSNCVDLVPDGCKALTGG